jgi:hypothetical protein
MVVRYLLFWFLLALVAIANGILRQGTYGKIVSELTAHQISTLTGIIFTGALVFWLNRVWPIESAKQAWLIGLAWLVLTIAFEFGFGHFVAGHPWTRLFADYDLLSGRVWAVFLFWMLVMPYFFFRLG